MKKIIRILTVLAAAGITLSGCKTPENTDEPKKPEQPVEPQPQVIETPAFAKGADVSWVSEMEASGKTFKKQDGSTADIFAVLKDVGINSIRLRVWVNPAGGWSGRDDCVALARRAADAGMALMIDFHYSDFFADPSRQTFPKDWEASKGNVVEAGIRVKEHTSDVLGALKTAGISPAWIQIGNETRNGFLWPLGQLWSVGGSTPGGWTSFASLYNAGYAAAKEVFPSALVMPHLNNAYDDNDWWFKEFKSHGCKLDAIALSHYPQTNSKMSAQQMNSAAISRIRALASAYGVPVIVSEVGVKVKDSASPAILKSFVDDVRKLDACKGVFYWEPEVYGWWKPAVYSSLGWNAYDMGAFTDDGRPSEIMNAFK